MYTILIVEDNKDIRDNLKRILKPEGFRVLLAKDGLDAFQNIMINIPDLIISDIDMPYVNGMELLKAIRDNSKTCSIPFIFLTSDNDNQKLREGLALSAKNYITKPFDVSFLLNTIKSLIQEENCFN